MAVTEILSLLSCSLLWISVNKKTHKIVDVNENIMQYENDRNKKNFKKAFISVICFLTITLPTFASAAVMLIAKVTQDDVHKHLTFLTFGIQVDVGMYYKYILLFVLRSYDITNCFVYAQMTCLLFSVISHNVSCSVAETCEQMSVCANDINTFCAARRAFLGYKKIQNTVNDLENAISLPLFYGMVFLLSELFALMTNIVPMVRLHKSIRIFVIVLWALLTTSFHSMLLIFRVSRIEENYKAVTRAFVNFPDDDMSSVQTREFLQLLKMSVFRDEVQVTAWGMFPIRRGFILTVVGTLATYGVLLVQFS
nr:uncharacterized protein LOC122270627 [Parasteatoda tepidariorum]